MRISPNYLDCAETQFRDFFTKATGIKLPNSKVVLIPSIINLSYGLVSSFETSIFINYNYLFVKVCWRSKSGIVYNMGDENIDCADIEFWIEGIDPLLVRKYLYPKYNNPFNLNNLSYELRVESLQIDLVVEAELKSGCGVPINTIAHEIDGFAEEYNHRADKSNGKIDPVHKWKTSALEGRAKVEFDLGLSGMTFMPKFLKHLSEMNCFSIVSVY